MTNTQEKNVCDSYPDIDPALMDSFFEPVYVPKDEKDTPIIDPSKFELLYDPNMSSDSEDPPSSPNKSDSKPQENNVKNNEEEKVEKKVENNETNNVQNNEQSNVENNVENEAENEVENNLDPKQKNPLTDSKSPS